MCGRARCSLTRAEIESYAKRVTRLGSTKVDPDIRCQSMVDCSFNVSPGQRVPILVSDADGGVTLRAAVWGLVPHFQKGLKHDHFKMFNARAEEVIERLATLNLQHDNTPWSQLVTRRHGDSFGHA